jgi:hypothetical protein
MLNAHEWAKSEPEGSVYIPLEDATNVFRIFSLALSYKKGASLLHMIRYELDNDSVFSESMSEFSKRFADSVASGEDYRRVLEEVSGRDFSWFFNQWYYGQGYPQFGITWWMEEDSLMVRFTQSGTSAQTPVFKTSMDLNLQLENGRDTTIRTWIEGDNIQKSFHVPEFVTSVIADPENWLLETTEIIKQESSEGLFTVSPNPFGEELVIRFRNGPGEREIILTDMGGKTLNKMKSSSSKMTLNTQDLRQGPYILQVMENNQSYTTRVVRQ